MVDGICDRMGMGCTAWLKEEVEENEDDVGRNICFMRNELSVVSVCVCVWVYAVAKWGNFIITQLFMLNDDYTLRCNLFYVF